MCNYIRDVKVKHVSSPLDKRKEDKAAQYASKGNRRSEGTNLTIETLSRLALTVCLHDAFLWVECLFQYAYYIGHLPKSKAPLGAYFNLLEAGI